VAGIVSGGSDQDPAIVLGRRPGEGRRRPIALVGRVACSASAENGPIGVGDLLTTSSTCGHAMKVTDPLRALGAVLGKALEPLSNGAGLITVLVALQ